MDLEKYEHFFSNILARSFVKDPNKRHTAFKSEEVTDIYLQSNSEKGVHLFGKTPSFYFVLTHQVHPTTKYEFSNVLMHDDATVLLKNFIQREVFLAGNTPEEFLEKLFLKHELDKSLEKKTTRRSLKI